MITPGFTFLSRTPQYETEHLYIIIVLLSDNEEAIMVNVTTRKDSSDTSCILCIGDHDFISRDSVINYKDAKKSKVSLLVSAIKANVIRSHSPVSEDILQRIYLGALSSPFFPEGFKQYIPNISQ